MRTQLLILAGPDKGRAFVLPSRTDVAIGRGTTSHAKLVDLAVSRIHCHVRLENGQAIVTDAKSASGTKGSLNARIIFTAPRDGMYRLVATSRVPATGRFTLRVHEIVPAKAREKQPSGS